MRSPLLPEKTSSLSVRIGRWFEASGTGWGVIAIAAVLLLMTVLLGGHIRG